MPRLSQIRTSALRDLAEQLRFTPRATLKRQIERAQALADEVQQDSTYEEAWLVRRITGYQPTIEEPAILVGAAVLSDLSALVERLCAAAKLRLDEIDEPVFGPDELASEWGVTRRTVERYRRQGLVALRVVDEGGAVRTVIPRASAERFQRECAERLAKAKWFSRIEKGQRDEIVRTGTRMRIEEGLSASAAARRLGHEHGRSRETIRQALLGAPGSEGDGGERLDDSDRRVIWRSWRMGASLAELERRFALGRGAAHRIVGVQRATVLRGLGLQVVEPSGLDESVLGLPAMQGGGAGCAELEAGAWVRAAQSDGPIPEALERALALGHALLVERAARRIDALHRATPSARALDEIETDLRWAAQIRIRLIEMMRGLTARMVEERIGRALDELAPERARSVHRVCMDAVRGAVEGAGPARGGRLAAPVALALNRALARLDPSEAGGGASGASSRARAHEIGLEDWTRSVAPWQEQLELEPEVARRALGLEAPFGPLLALRFGLKGGRPHTIDHAAIEIGETAARTSRLEREALVRAHSR